MPAAGWSGARSGWAYPGSGAVAGAAAAGERRLARSSCSGLAGGAGAADPLAGHGLRGADRLAAADGVLDPGRPGPGGRGLRGPGRSGVHGGVPGVPALPARLGRISLDDAAVRAVRGRLGWAGRDTAGPSGRGLAHPWRSLSELAAVLGRGRRRRARWVRAAAAMPARHRRLRCGGAGGRVRGPASRVVSGAPVRSWAGSWTSRPAGWTEE